MFATTRRYHTVAVLASVAIVLSLFGLTLALAPGSATANPTTSDPATSDAAMAHPATSAATAQSKIVNANPANSTPHVLDGSIQAVVEVGDLIILGGSFTKVSDPDGTRTYDRRNLVAFDKTTSQISTTFAPSTDDEVRSLVVAPDGKSVYVGGFFDTVNGTANRSLARLRISDGARWPGFTPPTLNGRVKDLKLAGGRLWIAGAFTHVDGTPQPALATLNPTNGAFDPYLRLAFEAPRNGGVRQVLKLDVSPDGKKLVAIGNFTTVEGAERYQIAMLGIGGSTARLRNWQTRFFTAECSSLFESYLRDVDFSPDGSYFTVVTTGTYGDGPPGPCDTVSRFESGAVGSEIEPSWVDYTGGDTVTSVAVTGAAVYTGGHFRWKNNPYGRSVAGRGAVSRPGIAALDPANGLPYRWNPTRTLGVGVFDLLPTSSGLWVASDTDRLGGEYHGRIGFFPLSGGTTAPAPDPGSLPGTVVNFVDGRLLKRSFDGFAMRTAAGARGGGLRWGNVRGAFMLDGTLYLGWSDGRFNQRSFDGTTYGGAQPVNGSDHLTVDGRWHDELTRISGMFFDHGRIYYTLAGESELYYRYFSPESKVVGPIRFTASVSASGVDFARTAGMLLSPATGKLYLGNSSDGNLRAVSFSDGRVSGTATVVSGPDMDGQRWNRPALFLLAR